MPITIVPALLVRSRKIAGVDIYNVPDADAQIMANDIYQELIDIKKGLSEDFLHTVSYATFTPYTNQFTLPTDMEKILMLSIKSTAPTYSAWVTLTVYTAGTKVTDSGKAYIAIDNHTAGATFVGDAAHRTQLREGYTYVVPKKLDYVEMDWYNENIETNPVYFFLEDKLNIYPRNKTSVVEGIRYDYIQKLATITTGTDDADIKIEDKFLIVWAFGTAYRMQAFVEKDIAEVYSQYQDAKSKAKEGWSNRHFNKVTEELPPLWNYRR